MKQFILSLLFLLTIYGSTTAQEEIQLYKNGPKESNGITEVEAKDKNNFVTNITDARMYAYIAPKDIATGAAVVICPGGGYAGISVEKEGFTIAKWFNKFGISAFVLYYRMPNGHSQIPLTDAQTAFQIIHDNAGKWNINKSKIGIIGFSAGGHLASTVGTHFTNKVNRPSFLILCYPVVTMNKEITHQGSRVNLLGENPSEALVKLYSNEFQVTKKTPPTFIVHSIDDKAVPIINSENMLQSLQRMNVPAELHKYDVGGHGFGMRVRGLPEDKWPDLLMTWLKANKLIN